MIKKWRTRFIIYLLIAAFIAVIGYYLYMSVVNTNKEIESYKDGIVVEARLSQLENGVYTDTGAHRYKYTATVDGVTVEGVTMTAYTKAEVEQAEGKIQIYVLKGDAYTSYEKKYVDNFTEWVPSQGIFLWAIAGAVLGFAVYYIVRIVIVLIVLARGEESIGRFEEAFHSKTGSNKYYKVKYTYIRDGEETVAVSPACYDGRQVDKLKMLGSFNVRYKGKVVVIDQQV